MHCQWQRCVCQLPRKGSRALGLLSSAIHNPHTQVQPALLLVLAQLSLALETAAEANLQASKSFWTVQVCTQKTVVLVDNTTETTLHLDQTHDGHIMHAS